MTSPSFTHARSGMPFQNGYGRMLATGTSGPGLATGVTISPSRLTVARIDPSLSFQVQATGARYFDVVLATDPHLLDAANAHQRTSRNFRSSRQDFLGEPVEIEAGFYLMPRVFLRDIISSDPRPTRLYYIAAAYDDQTGTGARYSTPPDRVQEAPFVTLSGDLVAANLSKVMGVAVERLGRVARGGQVVAALGLSDLGGLHASIGGLPTHRRVAPMARANTPEPAASRLWAETASAPSAPPVVARARPSAAYAAPYAAPQAQTIRPMPQKQPESYFDEDFGQAVQAGGLGRHPGGWHDLDAGQGRVPVAAAPEYDDGFGQPAPSAAAPAPTPAPAQTPAPEAPRSGRTIPPLDPMPVLAMPVPALVSGAPDDALLAHIIAEGAAGRYEAMNLDGGFRGRLGSNNPYYQRAHDGLRLGPHQAMQDNGELGELLGLMFQADPTAFAGLFGPQAQDLLAMTGATGPSGLDTPGGRGPRVQQLDGADLWQDPWIDRFRNAARHPAFQAAMRAQILLRRFSPLQPVAQATGLTTPRGMAMLMALAVHLDVVGAVAHLRGAVNPADTPARLGAALDALGFADLAQFCVAQGLPPVDVVDDATHFALIAALQALGAQSPVQVPDAEAIMDAMVTSAGPGPLGDALLKLRLSEAFGNPDGRG